MFKGLKLVGYAFESDTRENVDYFTWKKLMLSKNFDEYSVYKKKYLDDGVLRFLNKKDLNGERIGYLTFPRSGNTFLRKYLELISGFPTGSEMPAINSMPL